jgi:hypothetical protein
LSAQPSATNEVRIKRNHFMGWGFVLPSFLPCSHFLISITFRIINRTAAEKKMTWKNFIIRRGFIACEVKVFDENVSSNHITVFLRGKAALLKWQQGQIHGTKVA